MDMKKFMEKSLKAIQSAQSTAREYGNPEIGNKHLLYALISANDGLIQNLMKKSGKTKKRWLRRRCKRFNLL